MVVVPTIPVGGRLWFTGSTSAFSAPLGADGGLVPPGWPR